MAYRHSENISGGIVLIDVFENTALKNVAVFVFLKISFGISFMEEQFSNVLEKLIADGFFANSLSGIDLMLVQF